MNFLNVPTFKKYWIRELCAKYFTWRINKIENISFRRVQSLIRSYEIITRFKHSKKTFHVKFEVNKYLYGHIKISLNTFFSFLVC